MSRRWMTVGLICCLPVAGWAEEKYTLKLKHAAAGDVSKVVKDATKSESVVVSDPTGNVLQEKKQSGRDHFEYKETTATKAGGKPTKVTREYSVATKTVDDVERKLAYHGKTVTVEKKGDDSTFAVDGKAVEVGEVADIARSFDPKKAADDEFDKVLLPAAAVAAGDTWKIDPAEFLKLLGNDEQTAKAFDVKAAKASGKLVKAYTKGGKMFGVVEYEFTLPMKYVDGKLPCREGSVMRMTISMDACFDGSEENETSTAETTMTGTADVLEDEKPTGVVVKFDTRSVEKSTRVPAK